MPFVLLALSVVIAVVQYNLYNSFGKKHIRVLSDSFLFNGISFLFAFVVLLCFFLFSGFRSFSLYSIGLGAVYGLLAAGAFVFLVRAMAAGPLSYTTLISSCSMVIPTVFGAVFWKEDVHALHIVGLVLLLLSFIHGCEPKNRECISPKWKVYSLMAFLCNGAVGVLQKLHQTSAHANENNAFLTVAFLTAAILLLCANAGCGMRKKLNDRAGNVDEADKCDDEAYKSDKASGKCFGNTRNLIIQGCTIGLCIALTNKINLYLSGVLPSIFFFPVVNGSTTLLCMATGFLLFKERLSHAQTLGFCSGLTAVMLFSVAP